MSSSNFNDNHKSLNNMKKNLTLDLNQSKLNSGLSLLASPDITSVLKVDTPDLLKEKFAGGFVDALNFLHNGNSQQGSDSNASTVFNDQSNFMPMIKEEPQTVPNVSTTPPMSPVDMEYQERMKLERKRQRNRLAASKCRSRKLERISKLEDKVKVLKNENAELASVVNQLKEHVGLLKLEVMEHVNAGCPIINTQY
ncbi:hypothetical protein GEV33_007226 [Tenebrio molitor]|uniref:BZIP domain-containing protein n=1 Tax=Tenebrio molitor TaxID=7067 RepID=A0A8J6HJ32_TENMO|nr:hypothetical protein GEV33_007226 [Tenebrio molitor]